VILPEIQARETPAVPQDQRHRRRHRLHFACPLEARSRPSLAQLQLHALHRHDADVAVTAQGARHDIARLIRDWGGRVPLAEIDFGALVFDDGRPREL
jgi:hypothetical protein